MTPQLQSDLDKLLDAEAKATKGLWGVAYPEMSGDLVFVDNGEIVCKRSHSRENAAFIALARNTIRPILTAMQRRITELEAQLPEGMKHCTVIFKECSIGHGRLTATNWVQHECQQCEIQRLEAEVASARNKALDDAVAMCERRADSGGGAVARQCGTDIRHMRTL